MKNKRPYLIAVTGGIASGKTEVCRWFQKKGIAVYFADKLAHQVLNNANIKQKLIDTFGKEIFTGNEIDRKLLGNIVFDNPQKLAALNRIVHPEVRKKIREIIVNSSAEYLVFEIPLLFESGLQKAFDLSINIFADEKLQLERIVQRDQLSLEQARQRVNAQMSNDEKQILADINIENNGSREELTEKMNHLWFRIKKLNKKEVQDLLAINGSDNE